MTERVLDASAILAFLGREPGWKRVEEILLAGDALVSTVNQAEVVGKLIDKGATAEAVEAILGRLKLRTVVFTPEQAVTCGLLRASTRQAGLSLGDRACLSLGQLEGLTVVTADRAWGNLGLNGVEVLR